MKSLLKNLGLLLVIIAAVVLIGLILHIVLNKKFAE